jgi:polysaccharide export outer membrane protein
MKKIPFITSVSAVALTVSLLLGGCETPPAGPRAADASPATNAAAADPLTLHPGDDLKITFPGAANLDTAQRVRTDGRITLGVIGEVDASGLTPSDLEKRILELYGNQLVSKEVSVTVLSSTFSVFVSGAVLKPGKIISDHTMSALEAVMEAGGFDSAKADMQNVKIVRIENGRTKNFLINLKAALEGDHADPFLLKRADIVYVPEKFSWF